MKFRAIHLLFLGALVVVLGLVYAVIFGDAGLWMRGNLQEREAALAENIEELRRENRVLHRKYHDQKRKSADAPKPVAAAGGIILKFDETGGGIAADRHDVSAAPGISIQEARGLYGVGSLFLILLSAYFLMGRKQLTADRHA